MTQGEGLLSHFLSKFFSQQGSGGQGCKILCFYYSLGEPVSYHIQQDTSLTPTSMFSHYSSHLCVSTCQLPPGHLLLDIPQADSLQSLTSFTYWQIKMDSGVCRERNKVSGLWEKRQIQYKNWSAFTCFLCSTLEEKIFFSVTKLSIMKSN